MVHCLQGYEKAARPTTDFDYDSWSAKSCLACLSKLFNSLYRPFRESLLSSNLVHWLLTLLGKTGRNSRHSTNIVKGRSVCLSFRIRGLKDVIFWRFSQGSNKVLAFSVSFDSAKQGCTERRRKPQCSYNSSTSRLSLSPHSALLELVRFYRLPAILLVDNKGNPENLLLILWLVNIFFFSTCLARSRCRTSRYEHAIKLEPVLESPWTQECMCNGVKVST